MADKLAPGAERIQILQDAGATTDSVLKWKEDTTNTLRAGGATESSIDEYWGVTKPTETLVNAVHDNMRSQNWDPSKLKEADPNSVLENLWASLEWNPGNLGFAKLADMAAANPAAFGPLAAPLGFFAGVRPDMVPSKTPSTAAGVAQMVGDLPGQLAIGIPAGLAAGRAAGPNAGIYAGFAAPELVRQIVLDSWEHGKDDSWGQILDRTLDVLSKANLAGVSGLAGRGAGLVAGRLAQPLGKAFVTSADVAAFTAASTTASSLFNDHVPGAGEFLAAMAMGLLIPGGHALGRKMYSYVGAQQRIVPTPAGRETVQNMQENWGASGIPPHDQADLMRRDPYMSQTMTARNADGDAITGPWKRIAPPEHVEKKPLEGEIIPPRVKPKPVIDETTGEEIIEPLKTSSEETIAHNGLRPVESATPEQVYPLVKDVTIDPNIAKQYGFDPTKLGDPEYHQKVATEILTDYIKRFKNEDGTVDLEAVMIAMHSSPARAVRFRANGRQYSSLPVSTQRRLEATGQDLETHGGFDVVPPSGGKGKPPGPPRPLSGAEPGKEGHFKRNFETTGDIIGEGIGTPTPQTVGEQVRRGTTSFWSSFMPAKRLDRALGLDEDRTRIGADDAMRHVLGASGRAHQRIWFHGITPTLDAQGRPHYKPNPNIPSYDSVTKAASKVKVKEGEGGLTGFERVLQARRAVELANQGKKSITDPVVAQEHLDTPEAKLYDPMVAERRKVFNNLMDEAVAAKTLSQESANRILAENPDWFSQRLIDPSERNSRFGKFGLGKITKTAKGHVQMVESGLVRDVAEIQRRSTINSVNLSRRHIVTLLESLRLSKEGEAPEYNFADPLRIGSNRPASYTFEPTSIYGPDGNFLKSVDRIDKQDTMHDGSTITFQDGDRMVTYHVEKGQEEVARMLMNLESITPDLAGGFLKAFANTLRVGVSTPAFGIRMAVMDAFGVPVVHEAGGHLPFVNTIKGGFMMFDHALGGKASERLYGKQIVEDYYANNAYGTDMVSQRSRALVENWHKLENAGAMSRVANSFVHPVEGVGAMMRNMDSWSRLGGYAKLQEKIGPFKAGVETRKMAADFQERGASPIWRWVQSLDAYYNAWMRSTDTLSRAVPQIKFQFTAKDWATTGGTLWRGAVAIMSLSIMTHGWNNMIEDLYDVPERMRVRNQSDFIKDTHITIQIPNPMTGEIYPLQFRLWGGLHLFHSIPTRALEYTRDERPDLFKNFMGDTIKSLGPPGATADPVGFAISVIPLLGTAMRPMVEQYTNWSLSQDRPLIPLSQADGYGYTQYYSTTSETAKALSNILGSIPAVPADISPIVLENYVNGWTGPGIITTARLFDSAVGTKQNVNMEGPAANPLWGSFFARYPNMNSKPLNDFYDLYSEYIKARGSIANEKRRGHFSEMEILANQEEFAVKMEGYNAMFTNQRKMLDWIDNDTLISAADAAAGKSGMTREEKSQEADKIINQAIVLARQIVIDVRDARSALAQSNNQ